MFSIYFLYTNYEKFDYMDMFLFSGKYGTIIFKTTEQTTLARREAEIKEINKPLANFTGLYTCVATITNRTFEIIKNYIYFYPGI